MSGDSKLPTALDLLNDTVQIVSEHIDLYKKNTADFTRNRKLNADTLIKVILNMQGNSLNAELLDAFPDVSDRMTASALEQAKDKLKPEVFEHLLQLYNCSQEKPKLFHDRYRLYAIDGSDFNPPYDPRSSFVFQPTSKGENLKPFCQMHANILFDLMNRTYQDCVIQPRTEFDERTAALRMLKRQEHKEDFICIMDRGYEGFNVFETLNRLPNAYYVIRVKTGIGAIKEIGALPDEETDRIISFPITTSLTYYLENKEKNPFIHMINHHKKARKASLSKKTVYGKWDFEKHCDVEVRVVKFRINDPDTGREEWEVLVTNLPRMEFPLREMKKLYHMRWDIETSFRELKYALGTVNFHSKKDDFVRMELFAHFIMFNAVSRMANAVQIRQKEENKYGYKVDFKMACSIVRKHYRLHTVIPPGIFDEIQHYVVPIRPGRSDQRNMKSKQAVWFVYRVA